ncbi:pentatricopeptide repeat-containing protein-like [Iris pallida]|uniref:Pentatricopeptide repeat-containing protein-like n=1 Tax=Iris pallida TaxID=29817 RepID=A0AAX6GQ99_IRIPA|nr:pentatricopeptide repeat-containing protein-like [Iris pallida]
MPTMVLSNMLSKHSLRHHLKRLPSASRILLHYSHQPTNDREDAADDSFRARERHLLSLFKHCATMRDLTRIHGQIIASGFDQHVFVVGRIISFCSVSEHGSMDHASSVFGDIRYPDGFLYNTMIRGFGRTRGTEQAFSLYAAMLAKGKPADNFTYAFLVKICAQSASVGLGKQAHCCTVKRGWEAHVFVKNTLMHMYGAFEDMEAARRMFEAVSNVDLVSWNTLIDGYASCGLYKEAVDTFSRMRASGFGPDETTLVVVLSACSELGALDFGRQVHSNASSYVLDRSVSVSNSLIDMYAKCGAVDRALEVFEKMKARNTVSWNAMILGLAMHGHGEEALKLFGRMQECEEDQEPNDVTFVGVLCACSHGGLVEEGNRYFDSMQRDYGISPTVRHYGCKVDLLGRAGRVREAYEVIGSMPMEANAVIWRTLLGACRVHGDVELGERAKKHLEELEPDHSGDFVLLSHMYAGKDNWSDVFDVREAMKGRGLQKPQPGNCLISSILPNVTW